MSRLLAVLAYKATVTGVLEGTLNYRARLTAREIMAKVIRELPVGDFSAQLVALRETI